MYQPRKEKFMRVFLSFICGIALVFLAPEVHAGKHKDKKNADSGTASKPAQAKSADWTKPKGGGKGHGRNGGENANNGSGPPVGKPAQWSKPEGAGKTKPLNTWNNPSSVTYSKKEKNWSNANRHNEWNSANDWNNSNTVKYSKKGKNWSSTEKFTTSPDGQSYHYQSKTKVNTKHFNLSYNPNPTIQNVKFNKNYHINGSQNWNGPSYAAFRSYRPEWHDQWWWRSRYNRIVFISGGWYYWNAGWWYPAWGYAPKSYYAYDGAI